MWVSWERVHVCGWVLTNAIPALATPDWLALLVSSRLAVIVLFQLFPRRSLLILASTRPRAPEPPGTAKDSPNWVPVAVSSSFVVGFIGLVVTLLPPNHLFLPARRLPVIRGPAW